MRDAANAVTFDVEEYFQVRNLSGIVAREDWERIPSRVETQVARVLDLLAEREVRATFFCLGWVAERQPRLIRRIAERGHEIASHGYDHRLVEEMGSVEGFREDLRRAGRALEDASGRRVVGYRASNFSITSGTLWALDVLAEEGYRYDSSLYPVRHPTYGIPAAPRGPHRRTTAGGASLWEFPLLTWRVAGRNVGVAGGGWLRMLPLGWILRGIRQARREARPAVLYLHPWELDPDQPRLGLRGLAAYRHYHGLTHTAARLSRALREAAPLIRLEELADRLEGEGAAPRGPDPTQAPGAPSPTLPR